MKNCLALFILFTATSSFATSINEAPANLKLTPEMEQMMSDHLGSGQMNKDEARDMLTDLLQDTQRVNDPIAYDPLGRPVFSIDLNRGKGKRIMPPSRPDELKGCVTKTRTICTGTGKDRECTTDSWEVCVSSD